MPSVVADLEDRLGHPVGLLGVHARHRLVEQQQPRLGAQRPGHLDPLLVAVGQDADRDVAAWSPSSRNSAISRDPLAVHACPRGWPAAAAARTRRSPPWSGRGGRASGSRRPSGCRTGRCSGRPGRRRGGRSCAAAVRSRRVSPNRTCALGGPVDAGQHVEHRRLAGPVGTDDGVDRPGPTVNETSESALMAPKRDADVLDGQRLDVARRPVSGCGEPAAAVDVGHADHRVERLGPARSSRGRRSVSPSPSWPR